MALILVFLSLDVADHAKVKFRSFSSMVQIHVIRSLYVHHLVIHLSAGHSSSFNIVRHALEVALPHVDCFLGKTNSAPATRGREDYHSCDNKVARLEGVALTTK